MGQNETRALYARLPEAMHGRLRVAASNVGRPIAEIVREAVAVLKENDG